MALNPLQEAHSSASVESAIMLLLVRALPAPLQSVPSLTQACTRVPLASHRLFLELLHMDHDDNEHTLHAGIQAKGSYAPLCTLGFPWRLKQ